MHAHNTTQRKRGKEKEKKWKGECKRKKELAKKPRRGKRENLITNTFIHFSSFLCEKTNLGKGEFFVMNSGYGVLWEEATWCSELSLHRMLEKWIFKDFYHTIFVLGFSYEHFRVMTNVEGVRVRFVILVLGFSYEHFRVMTNV